MPFVPSRALPGPQRWHSRSNICVKPPMAVRRRNFHHHGSFAPRKMRPCLESKEAGAETKRTTLFAGCSSKMQVCLEPFTRSKSEFANSTGMNGACTNEMDDDAKK